MFHLLQLLNHKITSVKHVCHFGLITLTHSLSLCAYFMECLFIPSWLYPPPLLFGKLSLIYQISTLGVLSYKISHFPKRFDLGHILGPMWSADHSFVLVNLISYTQYMTYDVIIYFKADLPFPLEFLEVMSQTSFWWLQVRMLRKSAIFLVSLHWSIYLVLWAQLTTLSLFKFC